MKYILLVLIIIFNFDVSLATKGYPKIKTVIGKVWVIDKANIKKTLNKSTLLLEKAELITEVNSYLTLELDPKRKIEIQPESTVKLPGISWDTGEVPIVFLKSGELRWQQSEDSDYKIILTSELFEFIAPKGDYFLKINPKTAFAEVRLIRGHFEFSALNGDDSVILNDHQKASFQGGIENGEIAYDILLKGKKVPRGKLSTVSNFTKDEDEFFNKEEKKKIKILEGEKLKIRQALEIKKRQGVICKKPEGKFLECSYRCDCAGSNQTCEEYKCTAAGEWKKQRDIFAGNAKLICKSNDRVGECLD